MGIESEIRQRLVAAFQPARLEVVQAQVGGGVNLEAQAHHLLFAEPVFQEAPLTTTPITAPLEPMKTWSPRAG